MDLDHLLGRSSSNKGGKFPPCYKHFLDVKRSFPLEIALTRVREAISVCMGPD